MGDEEKLIACCGLYCGDCFNYKGEIADLSRELRKKLRENNFDLVSQGLSKYFKDFKNYPQCYAVLGAMLRLRCKRACRGGGGNPACKARTCCQKKNIAGCWECGDFETCSRLEFLKPIHGEANLKNLRKLRKEGTRAFLEGARSF